jgi:hypothetical protein
VNAFISVRLDAVRLPLEHYSLVVKVIVEFVLVLLFLVHLIVFVIASDEILLEKVGEFTAFWPREER